MSLNLMVMIPTHSGQMETVTAETLLQLQREVLARKGQMTLRVHSGSVISTLRNAMVADFLGSDADTLLMLDADQGISGQGLMRMIDFDAPVVGCLYPKRQFDWRHVRADEPAGDMSRILNQAQAFVGEVAASVDGTTVTRNGFAQALHVGTGILVIRRSALQTLMEACPDLKGAGFSPEEFTGPRFAQNWGFFNLLARTEGGGTYSEDYSFCQRWRDAGQTLWADVMTPTVHVGRQVFSGSYLDHVRSVEPPV